MTPTIEGDPTGYPPPPHPQRSAPQGSGAWGVRGCGGMEPKAPQVPFPVCSACTALLPPMAAQGRPRTYCGDACRVWHRSHPGRRRARPIDAERSREALQLWATGDWEPSVQPWSWPVTLTTRTRARELLAAH